MLFCSYINQVRYSVPAIDVRDYCDDSSNSPVGTTVYCLCSADQSNIFGHGDSIAARRTLNRGAEFRYSYCHSRHGQGLRYLTQDLRYDG